MNYFAYFVTYLLGKFSSFFVRGGLGYASFSLHTHTLCISWMRPYT